MAAKANLAADVAGRTRSEAAARCPHLVFRNVLGAETVTGLLNYVTARQAEFRPAVVRNRESGERRVDYALRRCMFLMDVGPFAAPIDAFVRRIAPQALAQLRLTERNVAPRDFEITAYGDGGHFGAHIDTDERVDKVRIVSCVYYFAATPRGFSGGELRLHGLPTLSARMGGGPPPFIDVAPETDTLVVIPSWLRHEVLPVRVPSAAWADGRFTVNCWIHRVGPSECDAPGRG